MKLVNDTVGYTKKYPEESKRNLEHYIGKELFKKYQLQMALCNKFSWH